MPSKINQNYEDRRTKRVLSFFAAKGLLIVPWIHKRQVGKLRIPDVLWVAEHVEPRVLEVLPAALLHFPAAFLQKELLPQNMKEVMAYIVRSEEADHKVQGISLKNFRRWTERKLHDGRTKPFSHQRRVTKSFRFPKEIADTISQRAAMNNLGESRYIEMLIRKDLKI